jgi:hypothetical protein
MGESNAPHFFGNERNRYTLNPIDCRVTSGRELFGIKIVTIATVNRNIFFVDPVSQFTRNC